jgi:hypothetical protein
MALDLDTFELYRATFDSDDGGGPSVATWVSQGVFPGRIQDAPGSRGVMDDVMGTASTARLFPLCEIDVREGDRLLYQGDEWHVGSVTGYRPVISGVHRVEVTVARVSGRDRELPSDPVEE